MATRFFLCNRKIYGDIYNDISIAKNNFANNQTYEGYWTCGRMKCIEAGDVAYFLRVGDKNRGVFAKGLVTEPPKDGVIEFTWESVIDFDHPLPIAELLQRPGLQGAKLAFRGSGYKLGEEYVNDFDAAWQEYILAYQLKNYQAPVRIQKNKLRR